MGHRIEPSGAAPRRSVPLGDWRCSAAPEPPAPGHPDGAPPGRLVVVSNRVLRPTRDGSSSAGGLAVALEGALKQRGGLWFGWSGKITAAALARALDMPGTERRERWTSLMERVRSNSVARWCETFPAALTDEPPDAALDRGAAGRVPTHGRAARA
jgi:trehalose-6-phosphate synthase